MYVAGGMVLGAAGSAFYGAFDHAAAYLVMRWAAAVALGWIGLSVAGFAPSLAVVDRFAAPITQSLRFSPAPAFAGGTGSLRLRPHLGRPALRHGVRRAVLRHAIGKRAWRRRGDGGFRARHAALGDGGGARDFELPASRSRPAGARLGRPRDRRDRGGERGCSGSGQRRLLPPLSRGAISRCLLIWRYKRRGDALGRLRPRGRRRMRMRRPAAWAGVVVVTAAVAVLGFAPWPLSAKRVAESLNARRARPRPSAGARPTQRPSVRCPGRA